MSFSVTENIQYAITASSKHFITDTLAVMIFCNIWGKFQAFYQFAKAINSDKFNYKDLKNSEHIYLRREKQFVSYIYAVYCNKNLL